MEHGGEFDCMNHWDMSFGAWGFQKKTHRACEMGNGGLENKVGLGIVRSFGFARLRTFLGKTSDVFFVIPNTICQTNIAMEKHYFRGTSPTNGPFSIDLLV